MLPWQRRKKKHAQRLCTLRCGPTHVLFYFFFFASWRVHFCARRPAACQQTWSPASKGPSNGDLPLCRQTVSGCSSRQSLWEASSLRRTQLASHTMTRHTPPRLSSQTPRCLTFSRSHTQWLQMDQDDVRRNFPIKVRSHVSRKDPDQCVCSSALWNTECKEPLSVCILHIIWIKLTSHLGSVLPKSQSDEKCSSKKRNERFSSLVSDTTVCETWHKYWCCLSHFCSPNKNWPKQFMPSVKANTSLEKLLDIKSGFITHYGETPELTIHRPPTLMRFSEQRTHATTFIKGINIFPTIMIFHESFQKFVWKHKHRKERCGKTA